MVTFLDTFGAEYPEQRIKRLENRLLTSGLQDFVTNNTCKLFTDLDMKTDVLLRVQLLG